MTLEKKKEQLFFQRSVADHHAQHTRSSDASMGSAFLAAVGCQPPGAAPNWRATPALPLTATKPRLGAPAARSRNMHLFSRDDELGEGQLVRYARNARRDPSHQALSAPFADNVSLEEDARPLDSTDVSTWLPMILRSWLDSDFLLLLVRRNFTHGRAAKNRLIEYHLETLRPCISVAQ